MEFQNDYSDIDAALDRFAVVGVVNHHILPFAGKPRPAISQTIVMWDLDRADEEGCSPVFNEIYMVGCMSMSEPDFTVNNVNRIPA